MTQKSRLLAIGHWTALSLAMLSMVPQQAALAGGPLKGKITRSGDKGIIIRPVFGGDAIIAPSDADGEVRLIGMAPGSYSIQIIGSTEIVPVKVGTDGRLAFAAYGAAQRTRPLVRRRAEPIAFDDAAAGRGPVYDLQEIRRIRPYPCAKPPPGMQASCGAARNFIDINASTPQEIVRLSPGLSMQSAVHIMVQREKGGPYTSIEDFARRNCPFADIAISQGAVQVTGLLILMPMGSAGSSAPGFKCQPQGHRTFSLYGGKHNYVGHVTLLR